MISVWGSFLYRELEVVLWPLWCHLVSGYSRLLSCMHEVCAAAHLSRVHTHTPRPISGIALHQKQPVGLNALKHLGEQGDRSSQQAVHIQEGWEKRWAKNADKERASNKEGLWRVRGGLEGGIRISQTGEQLPATAGQGRAMEIRASPCAVPVSEGE